MSNPRDIALLMDIAASIERILAFTEGMTKAEFKGDARTHLAVQHQIMVIGEAAKRLSDELRNELARIPWTGIARMRDRLIHGYDTVDLDVVWETVVQSLPQLQSEIVRRLADLDR